MTKDFLSALQKHFSTVWAGRTPLLFGGAAGADTPSDGRWARFTIRLAKPYQREVGRKRVRKYTPGIIYVQAFSPVTKGDGPAIALADEAALIYQSLALAGFEFEIPSVEPIGQTPDGKWYQCNCEVTFRASEVIDRSSAGGT